MERTRTLSKLGAELSSSSSADTNAKQIEIQIKSCRPGGDQLRANAPTITPFIARSLARMDISAKSNKEHKRTSRVEDKLVLGSPTKGQPRNWAEPPRALEHS